MADEEEVAALSRKVSMLEIQVELAHAKLDSLSKKKQKCDSYSPKQTLRK